MTIGGNGQAARMLKMLLRNKGEWVSTIRIMREVYGSRHLGIARIGARIADIKEAGYEVESTPYDIRGKSVIWAYRIKSD